MKRENLKLTIGREEFIRRFLKEYQSKLINELHVSRSGEQFGVNRIESTTTALTYRPMFKSGLNDVIYVPLWSKNEK